MHRDSVRVCLVSALPPPYGGISHWTQMVLRYAESQDGVALRHVDIANRWRAVDDRVAWKRIVGGGLQLIRDLVLVLWQITHGVQVIHLPSSGQFGLVRDRVIMTCARACRVPVVYHIRFGRVPALAGGRSTEWKLMTQVMRRAHAVIAIDAATTAAIRHHLPGVNVRHVPNCIDLHSLPAHQAGGEENAILFVGWVIPAKGIEDLIKAWAAIRPRGWRLLIVGPGNTEYQRGLLARYQPDAVEFLGEKGHAETMAMMARAKGIVLPSHTEGFPNVVVEAMGIGKPVIATRVGAIPEMLADGCGLLVPVQDAGALAVALGQVMGDARLRHALAEKARARATERYSLDVVFSQYLTIWREAACLK